MEEDWDAVAVVSIVKPLIRGIRWALYYETRSLACKSSALTHESYAGE